MTKRRIDKKQRQAEQLHLKRLKASGVWLTAGKVPPRPIPWCRPVKRAQLGKPQIAGR